MFFKDWNFIEIIFKPVFADYRVLRENGFEAVRHDLNTIFDIYTLHGVLDASRCRMPHHQ